MSEVLDRTAGCADGSGRGARANWLGFAASPAFVLMAWRTGLPGTGSQAMICAVGPEPSWLAGMTPMYLLMSGLHAGPWLRLIAGRRSRDDRRSQ
jgi:hypothetical protein